MRLCWWLLCWNNWSEPTRVRFIVIQVFKHSSIRVFRWSNILKINSTSKMYFYRVGAESGPHITLLLGFLRNSAHLALGLPVLPARMMHVLIFALVYSLFTSSQLNCTIAQFIIFFCSGLVVWHARRTSRCRATRLPLLSHQRCSSRSTRCSHCSSTTAWLSSRASVWRETRSAPQSAPIERFLRFGVCSALLYFSIVCLIGLLYSKNTHVIGWIVNSCSSDKGRSVARAQGTIRELCDRL